MTLYRKSKNDRLDDNINDKIGFNQDNMNFTDKRKKLRIRQTFKNRHLTDMMHFTDKN